MTLRLPNWALMLCLVGVAVAAVMSPVGRVHPRRRHDRRDLAGAPVAYQLRDLRRPVAHMGHRRDSDQRVAHDRPLKARC